jgi:hypothetical protein
MSKNISKKHVDHRTAIIIKTEKINIEDVSPAHVRFRDLINPESIDEDSAKSIVILRHFCAVEGNCSHIDPTKVPPELLTVIYEVHQTSTDEIDVNKRYGKINVNLLTNSYGILKNHVHPGVFVATGGDDFELGGFGEPDMHQSFGEADPATLKSLLAKHPEDKSFPLPLDRSKTKSVPLYAIIHRMVGLSPQGYRRGSWSAGMGFQIRAEGNGDPTIDGKVFKFFHMGGTLAPPAIGDRVAKGDFLGVTGRTGFMEPLLPNGNDSYPHLHLEAMLGSKRFDPIKVLAPFFASAGTPNDDWNRWVVTKKDKNGNRLGYSGFGQVRTGGVTHGGVDIGMPLGSRITSPVSGVIIKKQGRQKYLGHCKAFRDVIAAYNVLIRKGNYVFSYISKDKTRFRVAFAPDEVLGFGENDFSFQTHLAGKTRKFIKAEKTPKGQY